MVIKRVELLLDGYFEIDMGMLVYLKSAYYGKTYLAALKCLFIETENNRYIIDTGIGDVPESYIKFVHPHREEHTLERSLNKIGYKPEDINIVINTHLHYDHVGNNRLFKIAKKYVHKKELEYSKAPHRFYKGGYWKEHLTDMQFETFESDFEIEPGIEIIETVGHTPGHCSVVVEYKDKRYIFTGDCAPLEENIRLRNIIGILYSPVDATNALDRLISLNGIYITSHDNTQLTLPD